MRYGLAASNLPEWVALKLLDAPLPVLDTLLGPLQARAVIAAERAGVFRKLAKDGPITAPKLAADLALDAECLRLLLRVLRAMSYVELRAGAWSLTRRARRWYGPGAKEPYEAFTQFGAPQWRMIEQLDEVLVTGKGVDFHDQEWFTDWALYQRSMFENARASSWFVVDNFPVPPGARDLLDIAGSHGWLGAALARRHAGLRSTVLDRAEALAAAREIAKANGYDDVVTFEEGDLRTADFGPPRDAVLLSNILHHFGADENLSILRRVRAAMKPGATIGIFEIETPPDDAPVDAGGDAFALYFRITSNATCYRATDYTKWLAAAGFAHPHAIRNLRMPSRMLVVAHA
ncbi:MAG: methyltransferase domain-containing protein [Labilithrix sp.]|nr:methyltransferase domain-containing protein [Labilithrix sp.]MCW5815124.1 methyltransferase domain-containing protein [Labilithrix sp.]